MEPNLESLKSCPLFRDIAHEDLSALLKCLRARPKAYAKGTAVFQAGEPAVSVGIVLQGRVQVCREDADGNRVILAAIGPGGLFGEAYACVGAIPLPVSVWADEECHILLLDLGKATTLCSSACAFHSKLVRNLLGVLAQKNVFLAEKMEHLSKRTLREKLLSYLKSQEREAGAVFTVPFDRQALADYLCADRSALSRELGNLKRDGTLEYEKNRFRFP